MTILQGLHRVVVEGVKPEVDAGRFPIKRTVGEKVVVEADVFTDGHDAISVLLLYRKDGDEAWCEVPMTLLVNDRWQGSFRVTEMGRYHYTVTAWVDPFTGWQIGLGRKVEAEQDVSVDLLIGADLIEAASRGDGVVGKARLSAWLRTLRSDDVSSADKTKLALSEEVAQTMAANPDRRCATVYTRELAVTVDREKARFSAWYEMFPRSTAPAPGRHGTFQDCEARLPYIARMGFDVLYLPPIHPIGRTKRKGKNNTLTPLPDDVGVPWAIGAAEGGHTDIHPGLGTLEDFRRLVAQAQAHGIELAIDIAFQCSPDHPYVKEHPEWFRWRPDHTIQYAENPPKKYEDIYPFEFDNDNWRALWEELTRVVLFWSEQGVKIFRVDNPHTKPFDFWAYLIDRVKALHPDAIFLAEAFIRPKVMYTLAKLGFTQSYTYFAWRNAKFELTQYLNELTQTDVKEFFRPNFWPNTPDILNEYLQFGGRPAFITRLVLAATMAASYGIYGPAFELCEATPREPGSEEYLDSEKYQCRHWNLDRPDSLKDLISRVNRLRQDNPALHSNHHVHVHPVSNDELICYSKRTDDRSNIILIVVNLDPHHTQAGWVDLDLDELGLTPGEPYQMHDQLGEARYLWNGSHNYVELNPHVVPAHVFLMRRRVHTEYDFDYFM
jgi:starch synthase (maltosyl-transferring)